MSTIINNVFTINGVIDTNKSVLQNMQTLATAAGSWITYDTNVGKWSVIINRAGASVKSFTDSNIIGSINVRGTGIYELYNKVELNFANKDILDQKDVITLTIPVEDRFDNEVDNTLNFSLDCINNPLQAELLAARELKQSRIDKIVEFRTDFTSLGLRAGDIIDITNTAYGFAAKKFRVLTVSEEDSEDGAIVMAITAFEYDESIYSTAGLARTASTPKNDILSQCANQNLLASNAAAALKAVGDGAGNPLNALLLTTLLNAMARGITGGGGGSIPALTAFTLPFDRAGLESNFNTYAGDTPFGGGSSPSGFNGNDSAQYVYGFQVPYTLQNVVIFVQSPLGTYDYETKINGSVTTRSGFLAYVPSTVILATLSGVTISQATVDWQTAFTTIQIPVLPAGTYLFAANPLPTYDLNQEDTYYIYPKNISINSQASGGGMTVTVLAFNTQ